MDILGTLGILILSVACFWGAKAYWSSGHPLRWALLLMGIGIFSIILPQPLMDGVHSVLGIFFIFGFIYFFIKTFFQK